MTVKILSQSKKEINKHLRGISDFSGMKIGKLFVIEVFSDKPQKIYRCKCECGTIKNIRHFNLLYSHTVSCGCLRIQKVSGRKVDLSGKHFGRLQVLRRVEDCSNGPRYLCECECGALKKIAGCSLTSGLTKSCGCLSVEKRALNNKGGVKKLNIPLFDTYSNQIEPVEETRRDPENNDFLQVKCTLCSSWFTPTTSSVNNRIAAISGRVTWENRFYCSDNCKLSCSIFNKHKYPSYFKKKTIDPLPKEVKNIIKKIDNFECQICGETKKLVVHHVYPATQNPIFSADTDNCITICQNCHLKIHSQKGCRGTDLRCK